MSYPSNFEVTIVFRGEMLRDPASGRKVDNFVKRRPYLDTVENYEKQESVFKSILENIIRPYEHIGAKVNISGMVYDCPPICKMLEEYFPNNNIKMIESGKTNAIALLSKSLNYAKSCHPNSNFFISVRSDYVICRMIDAFLPQDNSIGIVSLKGGRAINDTHFWITNDVAFDIMLQTINSVNHKTVLHKPVRQLTRNNKITVYGVWPSLPWKASVQKM